MIALIVCLAILVVIQIFLSKAESKWIGLILPSLTFLCSLLVPLGLLVMMIYMPGADTILMLLGLFILGNIPTVILLVVNYVCREKVWKKKEIEKMKIQDLE